MKKTVSQFINMYSYVYSTFMPFASGYHISKNRNGKNRFAFKVEEDHEQEIYIITCRNLQQLNAVMRREFGWR